MKVFAPNYYKDFQCIAHKCRHSCCVGWEICIDEGSLEKYKNTDGDLGKRLAESIDGDSFRLDKDERCPFLNRKGLCDIIIEKGEDYLCQICRDHPRFYNLFSHRTEAGLGLSCEEAARIILTQKERTYLTIIDEEPIDEELPSDVERYVISQREKIFDILQDRSRSIDHRAEKMLNEYQISFPFTSLEKWKAEFLKLEVLEQSWYERLECLTDEVIDVPKRLECSFEKLLLYFIYRHTANAVDEKDFSARVAFSYLSYSVIKTICMKLHPDADTLCDIARQYSAEIEYSEENTDKLINMM